MKGEYKNIFKVACIYMATIIGAGFASGREILQFFSRYYRGGFYGIILSGLLFCLIGCFVLDKIYRERIRNYDEYLIPMVGRTMGWMIEVMVMLFMLSVFCIMIAGASRIIADHLHLSYTTAALIMSFICMLFILTSIKGIAMLSTVVTPILIAGMLFVGLYIIGTRDIETFSLLGSIQGFTDHWFFSAILYVSYNSLSSVIVMSSLLPYLKTRKTALMGGMLGGFMLCAVAMVLHIVIYIFRPIAIGSELPVLSIIALQSKTLFGIYTLILWLAMFIAAVTSGYCAVERMSSKFHVNIKLAAIVLLLISIPLSGAGFSKLIALLYPIFGYLGLFMVFMILLQGMKELISRICQPRKSR